MKHKVTVLAERGLGEFRRGLARAARAALQHQEAQAGSLTVLLTGSVQMQHLNAEFAGADHATDVLSFPTDKDVVDGEDCYFGDIAVCVPVAVTQAARRRQDPAEEVQLLVVHGVLHLLGHDHDTPDRKAQMWRAQQQILASLRNGEVSHHAAA